MRPPVELHRLISTAIRDRALAERLRKTPEIVYAEFGVPYWQQGSLAEDPPAALGLIGVHPNLQFKFLGLLGLLKMSPASVRPFIDQLREDNGSYR